MKIIYQPKGAAREYADWACNVYLACDHWCSYCYVPRALHMSRAEFGYARVREAYLTNLAKDAKSAQQLVKSLNVLLSFACDPYCKFDVEVQMTRRTIEILHEHGHSVTILTKGGYRAMRDIDLLNPGQDVFAASLTLLDGEMSMEWEPGAASPASRMDVLKTYHWRGFETWVSLEPVIDPAQTCEIIRQTHEYVGHYKVGRLNYHPLAKTVDWKAARDMIVLTLNEVGARYMLKKSLAEA